MILPDPPLDPTPDEARSALRRELLKPEYYDDNLVERLITWLRRQLDKGVEAAVDLPPLQTFAAMVLVVLLVGALVWLVRRARGSARAPRDKQAVLTDEAVTAAELRARAERGAGRRPTRGRAGRRLPGAGGAAGGARAPRRHPRRDRARGGRGPGPRVPRSRVGVDTAAALFDSVLYGDRPATREQALDVLTLDDDLAVLR